MDSLRRRVPFKFSEDAEDERVLDEQDELIQELRRGNDTTNGQYLLFSRIVLQFIEPMFSIFPSSSQEVLPTIPLPTLFTWISLFIHLNLALLFHSDQIRNYFQLTENPTPISFQLLYALSAVAPTLSIFLHRAWQTTVWWCFTLGIVYVVQISMSSIAAGNQSIAELEGMKYRAPGA
ncbi:hypothetical protein BDQ17DRAFT_1343070 [Cyathus striatus]|nr:hypothetical protein BDQ17DRAFT_1343070 [Cyathus striatus]